MLIIPLDSSQDRRLQALLGSHLLGLRTYWNPTAGAWYLDLTDSEGASIARGLRMVPTINLLEWSPELTRVYGQFRLLTLASVQEATEDNLGTGARLWWFAPGEFEAAASLLPELTPLPFDVAAMYSLDRVGVPKRLRFNGTLTFGYAKSIGAKFNGVDPRP